MSAPPLPLIFDIRRFSLDDGPGIRTTVFFKGCPLACSWCHNPESMRSVAEIAYHRRLCIRCHDCLFACRSDAIGEVPGRIRRDRCTACGRCVAACPSTALKRVGSPYPVEKLVGILLGDRIYYDTSGGGVTFSGGEPTLHPGYLGEVLRELKGEGIRTAIQTCGMFDPERFGETLLPHLDLIYFDLKLLDRGEHWRHTGEPNEEILANFERLTRTARTRVFPRVPLVPGITATRKNLCGIAAYLRALGYRSCELLSYNPGGLAKRTTLGREPPSRLPRTLPQAEETRLRELFASCLAGEGGESARTH